MAQGDKWNIGISAFDRYANLAFREYEQYAHFLNGETTIGASKSIETADINGSALDLRSSPYCVNPGSVLVFGPSTHTDNLNAVENFTVDSIDDTKVVGTLAYKYMAGDQITIRTIPNNWTGDATQVDGKLYERAAGVGYGAGATMTGAGYGAKMTRGKSVTPAISSSRLIQQKRSTLKCTKYNTLNQHTPTVVENETTGDTSRIEGTTVAQAKKSIFFIPLTSVSGGTAFTLRLFWQNSVTGKSITIYRVKQAVDGTGTNWNNYKAATTWDTAGCSTSGTDYHAGAVYTGLAGTGSGWQSYVLDAALMTELCGAVPSKANYGLIIQCDTTDNETLTYDTTYTDYEAQIDVTESIGDDWAIRTFVGKKTIPAADNIITERWLFKHDLSALVGKTVVSVTVTLTYTGANPSGSPYNVYRLKRNWTTGATYADYSVGNAWSTPGAEHADDAVAIGTEQTAGSDEGGIMVFPLDIAEFTKMFDSTYTNYGFIIRETGGDQNVSATDAPVLTVIYTDSSDTTHRMQYTSNKGTVLAANGRHRLACYYKTTGTYAKCFFQVAEYDYAGTLKATTTYNVAAEGQSYTLFSQLLDALNANTAYIQISIGIEAAITEVTTFTVALVTLEHAYGTSDTLSGYLEVTKNPAFDGASFEPVTGEKLDASPNNTVEGYDPAGGRVRWNSTSLEFRNVEYAQYDDLNEIARQSTAGGIVILRTWLSSYPAVMFGKFGVGRPYSTMRNFAKVNIPAQWTEIGV